MTLQYDKPDDNNKVNNIFPSENTDAANDSTTSEISHYAKNYGDNKVDHIYFAENTNAVNDLKSSDILHYGKSDNYN